MKTCNASKVCSKTQIIYTKTNNHDAPVRKRTNIYKSIRKSISQKTISAKLYFYLKTYSISCIYILRDQLYENMKRVTGVFEKQTFSTITYNHDVCCTKTHRYFKMYTEECKSRGHSAKNYISTSKSI